MSASPGTSTGLLATTAWKSVRYPDGRVAIAERPAIGTTARVATTIAGALGAARGAVDSIVHRLDQIASRFRPDSDLQRLTQLGGGAYLIGPGLRELIEVALAAASWTGGLVDPTVGAALVDAGYDRDFELLSKDSAKPRPLPGPVVGFRHVNLAGALIELPQGVQLDLGATAKAYGSDRSAAYAAGRSGAGVLVSLGGDIAVAGETPEGGWPVVIEEAPGTTPVAPVQQVRFAAGGLATSSTTRRRWSRDGHEQHHLIDPRSGAPVVSPWRTVTVAATTCVEANAAATATIIAGAAGLPWISDTGLPARLVAHDGSVVSSGGWPDEDGAMVPVVEISYMSLPSATSWERW